ncbi:ABC transporter substrate-binding protein [Anaerosphaera multitolerans]|uniref:Thiamine pyrimidine synthase n=1 Tax=Anaerosphaera multitolerans TaxID=2487351 RepID=A0A437S7V2_9FIRM|nr:ABC transporter substrate-binding protein [Anaerosphaera multitolerans]RVU55072.1 ABC transporter substrate-binding protein [Anaerosphaera multitolerans]
MNLNRKATLKILSLLLLSMILLVACSSNETKENKTEETTKDELTTVSIQIDGAAVPYYAPLYLAQEKGFFAEEGLNVEFYYAAAADIVKNVAAGNVEFGFPNADSVILAKSQDIPAKVIHTTYQNGLGATIFPTDSDIKEPSDLAGKKIAVTSYGSPNYIQLQVLLSKNGLSLDDVSVEIIGTGAILNALTTKEVDAIVFSMLRTIELNESGFAASEFRSDDYLPSFGNVLISSDKYIEENPEIIKGFKKALNKSIEYIIDGNVEEAVDLSIEQHATTASDKRDISIKIINEVFIPYLWQSDYTKENGIGASDLSRWDNLISVSKEYEIIDSIFPASDLIYE